MPVALELHPVREQYLRRWMFLLEDHLAGRRASPVFRQDVARAQVHFALAAWGQEPLPLEEDAEDRMLATLGAGSALAAHRLAWETSHRSDLLGAAHDLVGAIVTPQLTVQRSERGVRMSAVGNPDRNHRMHLARQQLEEGAQRPHDRRAKRPTVQLGSGLQVRGLDETDQPLLDASVYLQGRHVLFDDFRVSGLVGSQQWVARGTEQLVPGLNLTLGVQSGSHDPLPSVWSVATVTDLAPFALRGWLVRSAYVRKDPAGSREVVEHRVTVELRARLRWRTAQPPGGWGLGDRPDRTGPTVPGSRDHGPQEIGWLAEPDATRALVASRAPWRPVPDATADGEEESSRWRVAGEID